MVDSRSILYVEDSELAYKVFRIMAGIDPSASISRVPYGPVGEQRIYLIPTAALEVSDYACYPEDMA